MGHKIGDAVRLRPGSSLRELLDPWDDATGRVVAVFATDGPVRINVLYSETGPLACGVFAADFVPDMPLAAAPF